MNLLKFLLCLSLIWTQSLYAFEDLKFHLVLPTVFKSFVPGRDGLFQLEFRNTPLNQMGATLETCRREGLLPAFNRKPPELVIYLPNKEILDDQMDELAAEARQQFKKVYPEAELKIRFRVVETNINVHYVYSKVKRVLKDIKKELRDKLAFDKQSEAYVDMLDRANESAYRRVLNKLEVTAPMARSVKFSIAGTRAFIVFATRAFQAMPALASGDAMTGAALALMVTDAVTEFFTVAYPLEIQDALEKVPFNFRNSPQVQKFVGFMQKLIWNLTFFSVGRPTLMQALAHMTDPDVPAPTTDSVEELLYWSLGGVAAFSFFTDGAKRLQDKGWVSTSQINMAMQISGVFDLATGIINSNPNWHFYRLFTWGPQWTFFALIGLLGRLLPPRADKVVAVATSVQNWRDVHEEYVTNKSWWIEKPEDLDAALEVIRNPASGTSCEASLLPHGKEEEHEPVN
ncbi:MAG: hypothetical protein AB7G93_04280 [Bdellovibrionales bacterium]